MFDYDAYLKTDEWLKLRRQVLNRAGQNCEGCGVKLPTEVHHLTNDHVGNEFLFELVAVCQDCHQRLHPQTEGKEVKSRRDLDLDFDLDIGAPDLYIPVPETRAIETKLEPPMISASVKMIVMVGLLLICAVLWLRP